MPYFISGVFYIFYTMFMYLIGTSVCKEDRSDSFRLIIGYIIYTAIYSSVTIPIQMFNYTWNLYKLWMYISIAICICIIGVQYYRRKKIVIFPQGFKKFGLDNIVFIALVFALISVSYCDSRLVLSNNYTDDAFYLMKISTIPYLEKPFWVDPSSGIVRRMFKFDTYLLNTWECEAAFYSSTLGVEPSVFVKFGLSAFNYYMFINAIHAVFEKCMNEKIARYVPVIILFFTCFGLNAIRLSENAKYIMDYDCFGINLVNTVDGWQFTSAMDYGNIFVRTSGIFFCLLPFVKDDEFKFKHLLWFGITSFVLMTKSTCALPIVVMIFIGGLFSKSLTNKKTIWKSILILLITLGATLILKENPEIRYQAEEVLTRNIKDGYLNTYIIITSLMCLFAILRKEKNLFIVNGSALILMLILCVEPFNKILDATSMYYFVESRTLEGAIYMLVILCFANILYFLKFVAHKNITHIIMMTASIIFVGYYLSLNDADLKIADEFKEQNNTGIIDSTEELSYALNDLCNETENPVNVLSFYMYVTDENSTHHYPSLMLRINAPEIRSISSIYRFGNHPGNAFSNLHSKNRDFWDVMLFLDNGYNREKFYDFLDDYPINCLVSKWDMTSEIGEHGFNLYRTIEDKVYGLTYYIYFNPDVVDDKEYAEDYGYDDDNWCFEMDQEYRQEDPSVAIPEQSSIEGVSPEVSEPDTNYSDEINIDESEIEGTETSDTDTENPDTGGSETVDPGTGGSGTVDPGTGGSETGGGIVDPGTGGDSGNPGTGGSETVDPGTGGGTVNPGTGGTSNGGSGTGDVPVAQP